MFGLGTPTRRRGLVNVSSSPFTSTNRPSSAATPKKRYSVADQSNALQIVHQGQKYSVEASNTLPIQVRDASFEGLRISP